MAHTCAEFVGDPPYTTLVVVARTADRSATWLLPVGASNAPNNGQGYSARMMVLLRQEYQRLREHVPGARMKPHSVASAAVRAYLMGAGAEDVHLSLRAARWHDGSLQLIRPPDDAQWRGRVRVSNSGHFARAVALGSANRGQRLADARAFLEHAAGGPIGTGPELAFPLDVVASKASPGFDGAGMQLRLSMLTGSARVRSFGPSMQLTDAIRSRLVVSAGEVLFSTVAPQGAGAGAADDRVVAAVAYVADVTPVPLSRDSEVFYVDASGAHTAGLLVSMVLARLVVWEPHVCRSGAAADGPTLISVLLTGGGGSSSPHLVFSTVPDKLAAAVAGIQGHDSLMVEPVYGRPGSGDIRLVLRDGDDVAVRLAGQGPPDHAGAEWHVMPLAGAVVPSRPFPVARLPGTVRSGLFDFLAAYLPLADNVALSQTSSAMRRDAYAAQWAPAVADATQFLALHGTYPPSYATALALVGRKAGGDANNGTGWISSYSRPNWDPLAKVHPRPATAVVAGAGGVKSALDVLARENLGIQFRGGDDALPRLRGLPGANEPLRLAVGSIVLSCVVNGTRDGVEVCLAAVVRETAELKLTAAARASTKIVSAHVVRFGDTYPPREQQTACGAVESQELYDTMLSPDGPFVVLFARPHPGAAMEVYYAAITDAHLRAATSLGAHPSLSTGAEHRAYALDDEMEDVPAEERDTLPRTLYLEADSIPGELSVHNIYLQPSAIWAVLPPSTLTTRKRPLPDGESSQPNGARLRTM